MEPARPPAVGPPRDAAGDRPRPQQETSIIPVEVSARLVAGYGNLVFNDEVFASIAGNMRAGVVPVVDKLAALDRYLFHHGISQGVRVLYIRAFAETAPSAAKVAQPVIWTRYSDNIITAVHKVLQDEHLPFTMAGGNLTATFNPMPFIGENGMSLSWFGPVWLYICVSGGRVWRNPFTKIATNFATQDDEPPYARVIRTCRAFMSERALGLVYSWVRGVWAFTDATAGDVTQAFTLLFGDRPLDIRMQKDLTRARVTGLLNEPSGRLAIPNMPRPFNVGRQLVDEPLRRLQIQRAHNGVVIENDFRMDGNNVGEHNGGI